MANPVECTPITEADFFALIADPIRLGRAPVGHIWFLSDVTPPEVIQKRGPGSTAACLASLTHPTDVEVSLAVSAPAADTVRLTVTVEDQFGEPVNGAFVLIGLRGNGALVSAAVGPTGKVRAATLVGTSGFVLLATHPANVGAVDIVGTNGEEGDADVLVQSPGIGHTETAEPFVF